MYVFHLLLQLFYNNIIIIVVIIPAVTQTHTTVRSTKGIRTINKNNNDKTVATRNPITPNT